jgi:hypothetical protein
VNVAAVNVVAVGAAADVVAASGVPCAKVGDVPLTFDGVAALVVDVVGMPRACDVPLVVLVDGRWAHDHRSVLERGVRHVVARSNTHDLGVVLRALASHAVPGPPAWLGPLTNEMSVTLGSSSEKHAAIAAARVFVERLEIAERLVANACHIVEELVTNAIFNAPVHDDTGEHLYARRKRNEDVALPDGKRVELTLRSDGARLAITVADPWGTLPPGGVHAYLAKGFRRGPDQVDAKDGGAGLGLYQVFDAATHLVAVIAPRTRTEMTALIDIGGTYRDFAAESKSLNVFVV